MVKKKINIFPQNLRILLNQPLVLSARKSEIDIICTVVGGGLSGQAGAIRHGIARALVNFEPDLRKNLKSKGLLTETQE